jgi:predicted  nucleic acid-binding Zn-ribbon protein
MSEKENTLVELNIQISELKGKLSDIKDAMTADAILIAEGEAAKARLATAKREHKTMDSELRDLMWEWTQIHFDVENE